MGTKLQKAHQVIDYVHDAFVHGSTTAQLNDLMRVSKLNQDLHLTGNDAINPLGTIAQAVLSPAAAVGGIANGRTLAGTMKEVYGYGSKQGLNYANIAGSAFTVGVGMGVARGLTHDSAGNPDIAGIPMI